MRCNDVLTFRTGENSSKRLAAAAVAVTLTTSFSSSRNSHTSNECASLSTMSVRKTETLLDKARTQWQAAARTPTRGWRNDSRIRGRSCASRTARRCVSEVAQRVAIDNRSPCTDKQDEQTGISERRLAEVFPSAGTYLANAAEFLKSSRCRIRILLLDVLGEECPKDIETLRGDCTLLHVWLVGDVIGCCRLAHVRNA